MQNVDVTCSQQRSQYVVNMPICSKHGVGGCDSISLKLDFSFAEYSLIYRALLQKRLIILKSLLLVATPQKTSHTQTHTSTSHKATSI